MSLGKEFEDRIRAGVAGIIIQSSDQEDALSELRDVCRKHDPPWEFATFDPDLGALLDVKDVHGKWKKSQKFWNEDGLKPDGSPKYKEVAQVKGSEWAAAIRGFGGMTAHDPENLQAVLVLLNPGHLYTNHLFLQMVANKLHEGKQLGHHIVFLCVNDSLPADLKRVFEAGHLKHPLPDKTQIVSIIEGVHAEFAEADSKHRDAIVSAASGLTRIGVEDAASLSLVRHKKLDQDVMFDLKAQAFSAGSAGISIHRGELTFATYGGAPNLKNVTSELLAQVSEKPKLRPRGIAIVGPAGTGKDYFIDCLAGEIRRPIVRWEIGGMKSKYQGEAYSNMLRAIEVAEAMSPCLLHLSEIEGQISGGKGTGDLDAGVSSQQNSKFLHWLNAKTADVFVIVTANDIRGIDAQMPEFFRQGRFDDVFFMDYPSRLSKDEIWKIHLAGYDFITAKADVEAQFKAITLPDDDEWTGAEIEACCRLAATRRKTVAEIGKNIVVTAKRAATSVNAIRVWANGNCSATEYEGIYYTEKHQEQIAANTSYTNGRARRILTDKAGNN